MKSKITNIQDIMSGNYLINLGIFTKSIVIKTDSKKVKMQ
jgi:ribosomal protein S8E